jgi:hypothetical protein
MTKKYELTTEHRAQLKPWADKWIANAMSTKPMDEEDKRITKEAIHGMYAAADKPAPIVVFAPSPFVARFASGFACAIWHKRNGGAATYAATDDATSDATYAATRAATRAATGDATYAATYDATDAATYDATDAATYDATDAATRAATYDATYDATDAATRAATRAATDAATGDATYAATYDATYDATDAATGDATYAATYDATYDATDNATYDAKESDTWYQFSGNMPALSKELGLGDFGLQCAQSAYRLLHGGNQWSGWTAYLSFFRHVAQLPLDYSKWDHFEVASVHSGPRYMHAKFCIVSDRPTVLKVDDQNRPHCEDGPFCQWSDGSALYAWHGTYVPASWILNKENLDPNIALTHSNIEQRRAAAEIIGMKKVLELLQPTVIDRDDPEIGTLLEVDLPDAPKSRFLKVKCGTKRDFVLSVPQTVRTAKEANAWTYGLTAEEFDVEIRT